jgi:hypothetical protein
MAGDRVTSKTDWHYLAWFNFSTFAGDKSWVAGVELPDHSRRLLVRRRATAHRAEWEVL